MRTAILTLLGSMVLSAAAMPRERRSYRREIQRINSFKLNSAEERRLMRAKIGVMAIAGFFGLSMSAEAQTRFDGTYQLSYSSKVNDTFMSRNGVVGSCQERRPSPLIVADGMVSYTTETGRNVAGRVRPNGDFEFGFVAPDGSGSLRVGGIIGSNGTVRVRQLGNSCSYDFVWQKQS